MEALSVIVAPRKTRTRRIWTLSKISKGKMSII